MFYDSMYNFLEQIARCSLGLVSLNTEVQDSGLNV